MLNVNLRWTATPAVAGSRRRQHRYFRRCESPQAVAISA